MFDLSLLCLLQHIICLDLVRMPLDTIVYGSYGCAKYTRERLDPTPCDCIIRASSLQLYQGECA